VGSQTWDADNIKYWFRKGLVRSLVRQSNKIQSNGTLRGHYHVVVLVVELNSKQVKCGVLYHYNVIDTVEWPASKMWSPVSLPWD
jgi:hypothetical protein